MEYLLKHFFFVSTLNLNPNWIDAYVYNNMFVYDLLCMLFRHFSIKSSYVEFVFV